MATSGRVPVTLDNARLPQRHRYSLRRKLLWIGSALLLLLLLALLPPLINVNRFQRRIVSSMSASLGRPVHLDRVHIVLFPFPGFLLDNVVVSEIPLYGAEPVMRSNTVHATLRMSSLWRGRLEFSTISLDEPSVNVVRNAAGEWNIQSILLQASQIASAPTEQSSAGSAPRFPYIQASDARVNLKLRDEKTPFSLTTAEFALWQPEPGKWRLRLQAHPVRTDTDATDTGTLHIEGTMSKAPTFTAVPIDMHAEWKTASLGEASKLVIATDAGWRGNVTAAISMRGTLGDAAVTSDVQITDVRRADFVPARTLQMHAHCAAQELDLHALNAIDCAIPLETLEQDREILRLRNHNNDTKPGSITLTGAVPDVNNTSSSTLRFALTNVDANYAVDVLRLFSVRIPVTLQTSGSISGEFVHPAQRTNTTLMQAWLGSTTCRCLLILPYLSMSKAARAHTAPQTWTLPVQAALIHIPGSPAALSISPDVTGSDELGTLRALSTGTPAILPSERIDFQLTSNGYRMQTVENSPPTLLGEIARRFPPLGDGLADATAHLPVTAQRFHYSAERIWGDQPEWSIGVPR